MWFWCGRNTYPRSSSQIRRSSDGKWQNQSSQRIEKSYQDQRSRKLLRICKPLSMLYQEFQSYGKTSQQAQEKERVEIGWWTSEIIQRTQEQNHKLTCTYSSKERRKNQSTD